MSIGSQKIIEIIQYISFTGLVLSGLTALFLSGLRKKMVLVFMVFVFTTIIAFVFYSGILLFVTGFAVIFVFTILYMLTAQLEMTGNGPGKNYSGSTDRSGKTKTAKKKIKISAIYNIAIPVLFCGYLGYLIYSNTHSYFEKTDGTADISIISLGQISEELFSNYFPVLLILISAVVTAAIWFTVILDHRKERQKESRR